MIFGNSSKDLVLGILSEVNGLSAKEIYVKVCKVSDKDISYQAVHKLLLELVEEKVLVKHNKNYLISEKWIQNIKKKINLIEQKYNLKKFDYDNDLKEYQFNGILELANFLINDFLLFPNPKSKPSLNLWFFPYSIVGLSEEMYSNLKNIYSKTQTFCFVNEMNNLDLLFSDALKKYGIKSVIQKNNVATELMDISIVGDFIAHIWYDSEFKKIWETQNRSPKSLSEFDLAKHLTNMQAIKSPIKVIVVNDSELADDIRKKYLLNNQKRF